MPARSQMFSWGSDLSSGLCQYALDRWALQKAHPSPLKCRCSQDKHGQSSVDKAEEHLPLHTQWWDCLKLVDVFLSPLLGNSNRSIPPLVSHSPPSPNHLQGLPQVSEKLWDYNKVMLRWVGVIRCHHQSWKLRKRFQGEDLFFVLFFCSFCCGLSNRQGYMWL